MAQSPDKQPLRITIAGQNFGLRAAPQDVERLQQAAERAQQRIEILQKSGVGSTQRAAILAAFQLAYELDNPTETTQNESRQDEGCEQRLKQILTRLDEALGE